MSSRSGDQRRQKKKREERRRRTELQQQYQQQQRQQKQQSRQGTRPTQSRPDGGQRPVAAPAPPVRERTPIDQWWDEYSDADGPQQLQMIREKLQTIQPGDEWYEAIVPEAISSLESELPEAEYVAFLEDLRTSRPDVFAAGEDWNVWSIGSFYIAEERWDDLDRAVFDLADHLTEVNEPLFSLMSVIRLAGRAEAAQRLIESAISPGKRGGLMPDAVDELIEWALYPHYQACVQAGVTDEAVDALHRYSVEIGCDESEDVRENQRQFALHLAGKGEVWPREEFVNNDRQAWNRIYLLTVDWMRWLSASRGFPPLVADEMRRILVRTMNRMECKPSLLFGDLRRLDIEPAIADYLGFMSLDRVHAPAALVALEHFRDFQAEAGLVKEKHRDSTHAACGALWTEVQRVLGDDWRHYRFLEQYLPR